MVKFLTWLNNRLTLQDAIASPAGVADAGKIVALNSAGMVDSLATRDRNFHRRRAEIFSDFIGGFGEWASTTSGAGAANSVTAVTTMPTSAVGVGFAQHSTGTTASGKAALMSSPVAFQLLNAFGAAYFRASFFIPNGNLGGSDFIYRVGFIDNNSSESADGCFLRINGDANPVIEFVCRTNNVESSLGPFSSASLELSQEKPLVVEIVVSFVLGTPTASLNIRRASGSLLSQVAITTNIPSSSLRLTGAGSYLQKTVGTTARIVNLDYMYAGIDI